MKEETEIDTGKMTKKEIKEKIDQLESDMHKLRLYENIEGYKILRDQIQKMKDDYDKLILPKLNEIRDEINILKTEYKKPTKEKPKFSKYIQGWLYNWQRGVNFGYGIPYIRWISPDKKYVIITTPGGTAGTGTPGGTGAYYYAQASHYLVKVIEGAAWIDRVNSKIAEHEGRLTKEIMQRWINLINE